MRGTVLILHAQMPFIHGGAELLVELLKDNFVRRGYKTDIVALPFRWFPKSNVLKDALLWRFLDLWDDAGKEINLVIATKFPSYLIRHPNKVVWLFHQHREAYDVFGTKLSSLNNSPEDITLRDAIVELDNITLREARRLFSGSKTVAGRLKKYNGLDAKTLYPLPRLKDEFRLEEYGDFILYAGRLDWVKRGDLLIEAMRYVRSPVRALIAGSGPFRPHLEHLIEKYGLKDRVKLLGFVPDSQLIHLYASSLAVFFAPIGEDFGYITIEAFLSKKPVLTAPDSGGVLEFVEDGKTGFIIPPSPELFAEKMDLLYEKRKLAKELGEEGYRRVKDLSWDYVIDHLTEILREG